VQADYRASEFQHGAISRVRAIGHPKGGTS
jgi:hypothetical protein